MKELSHREVLVLFANHKYTMKVLYKKWVPYSGKVCSTRNGRDQAEQCTATTDVRRLLPTAYHQASISCQAAPQLSTKQQAMSPVVTEVRSKSFRPVLHGQYSFTQCCSIVKNYRWMFSPESVCLCVCQHDNFQTSKHRMMKLRGRCIVEKSRLRSNVGVIAPWVCTPKTWHLATTLGKSAQAVLLQILLFVGTWRPLVSVITTLYYIVISVSHDWVWYLCTSSVLCVYSTFRHHLHPLGYLCASVAELAHGEKPCTTHAINHTLTHLTWCDENWS